MGVVCDTSKCAEHTPADSRCCAQESATKIMSLRKWFALRAAVWEALGVESEADSDKRAVVARFAPALPPIS